MAPNNDVTRLSNAGKQAVVRSSNNKRRNLKGSASCLVRPKPGQMAADYGISQTRVSQMVKRETSRRKRGAKQGESRQTVAETPDDTVSYGIQFATIVAASSKRLVWPRFGAVVARNGR